MRSTHLGALDNTQLPTIYTTVLDKIMIAHDRFPKDVVGRKFGIANRTVYSGLRRLAMAKSLTAVGWAVANTVLGPREAIHVDGIPIFECDALTVAETQVV